MNEAYSSNSNEPQMLLDNEEFIRDPTVVCSTFNRFLCNNCGDNTANMKDFDAFEISKTAKIGN